MNKNVKNIFDVIGRNFKKKQLSNYNSFGHKYFWHNGLLNYCCLSFYLTQHLFLHYLGKADQAKNALK